MSLQFIHDHNGNTTGVFIPIEDWQQLKLKYTELQMEEAKNPDQLASWQSQIVEDRLSEYYKKPKEFIDFDKTIDEIEKSI